VTDSTPPDPKPAPNPLPYLLLLGFALVFSCPLGGFAAWCYYDGTVTYPQQRERALAYQELKRSGDPYWEQQWAQRAAARGWPTQDPGKPTSRFAITTQFIMFGITGGLAALLLLLAAVSLGLFIRATLRESADPRPNLLDRRHDPPRP